MCKIMQEIENRGYEKGIEYGMEKGREEGVEIGRQEIINMFKENPSLLKEYGIL